MKVQRPISSWEPCAVPSSILSLIPAVTYPHSSSFAPLQPPSESHELSSHHLPRNEGIPRISGIIPIAAAFCSLNAAFLSSPFSWGKPRETNLAELSSFGAGLNLSKSKAVMGELQQHR